MVTGCLTAITRKPIAWIPSENAPLDSNSQYRNHHSYNRLGLPLISKTPLLYRTHYAFKQLMKIPSEKNSLIFLTRNPKELLYRKFFLEFPSEKNPDVEFIENFSDLYLQSFFLYNSWNEKNRKLLFYEDFIQNKEEILLKLLQFMKEPPLYWSDFLTNQQGYLEKLHTSYTNQHIHNLGGISSRKGPQRIFYTKDADLETLCYIDQYLQRVAPLIWEMHLKQFATEGSLN